LGSAALAVVVVAVLVSSIALAAPSTVSVKKIAFVAKYTGTATVKVTDNVADITATGTGTGTLLGAGKVSGVGKGDTTAQPCVPFTGPGTITGKAPTKLMFKVIPGSIACGDADGNVFSISGKAAVVKGTGKLAKVKGTLKLTGTYDRSAGTFSVRFAGKLTQP
jgi:hypothetical protein